MRKETTEKNDGFAEPQLWAVKGNTDKQDMEGEGVTEHEDSESAYNEKIKRILVGSDKFSLHSFNRSAFRTL